MPHLPIRHRSVTFGAALLMVIAGDVLSAQNRSEEEALRDQWQKTDAIFAAMRIRAGAVVADIGSGDGFLTTRLATAVGSTGRVYAVDVADEPLKRLRQRLDDDGARNVTIVKGAVDDPKLPEGALDAALIVNAYHEMEQYRAILPAILRALKPDGRLVIVEPISDARRAASRAEQTKGHEIAPEFVLGETRAAGFRVTGLEDPFVIRKTDVEWMMVLAPRGAATAAADPAASPVASSSTPEDDPALRVSLDEMVRLVASRAVTIVDVRDADSFEAERIAGAISIPLTSIETSAERLRTLAKPVITYCS
jgi:predicted methyltransferase